MRNLQDKLISGLCKIFIIIMLSASAMPLFADREQRTRQLEEIMHAVRILKDIDTDQSKEWAVTALMKAVENDSVPYAMNALGLAYMAGAGVARDSTMAVWWLEKSGQYGYNEAYHNLGMIYKDGKGGMRQDFTKAYNAFRKGADKGSIVCRYDAGFMLYKGLGCQQDYAQSAELFLDGANADHCPSLYMLGLCYRNGYGVEQDTARASFYLGRSAAFGFRPAMEEQYRIYPENSLDKEFVDMPYGNVPSRLPEIHPAVNDTSQLYGRYYGFVAMYDWSGIYLLGEKPVEMDIHREALGKAHGVMVLSGDTIPFRAEVTADGKLIFSKGELKLAERYTVGGKVNYKMDNAVLDVWNDKIAGRLSLYSLRLREPERPMYMELARSDAMAEQNADKRHTRIHTTPNPFADNFKATFELLENCDAEIRIFDSFGRLAYRRMLGRLSAGCHSIDVTPAIINGTYLLNIKAGKQVLRKIIVKKEGQL